MSGLFSKPKSSSPERYVGMQLSSSIQGQPIPLVYGRNRVPANLGWYGNFQSHPQSSGGGGKGGGGGSTTSYTYTSAWLGILCIGPIQNVWQVWLDKSLVSLTSEGLSLFKGASGQATWTGYPSGTPAGQQIPYDHQTYVAASNYNLGSSAAMPNLTYEVEGVVGGYSNAHAVYDADPSVIVTDYLTDSVHGAGFLGTINTGLLTGVTNTYQAYCMSLGLLLSPLETSQRSATDFLKELMQMTNSDVVLSGGSLKVIPYADTAVSGTTPDGVAWSYTPNLTPVYSFTDDDFCPETGQDPVKLVRKPIANTFNTLSIEVVDRGNYYNPTPVTASDLNDIALRGPRLMPKLTFHAITSPTVGKTVAQLLLQTQLYERNTYEFRVRADYSLLEPMDYIAITDTGLGLTNQVCRVVEIQDDDNNFFTIKAMEIPGTVRNTPQYNWNSNAGYAANFDAAPLNVVAPLIFAMPLIPASQGEGITVGIAVGGQTSDGVWGGCEVFMSLDGGNTYAWVGTVGSAGGAKYGTISTAITAVPDPDTTTTLGVSLNNTNMQLSTTVTHAQADANETLLLVGSGATTEVMSYGTGALASAGNYNLSYLRRGLYGTTPAANSIGAPFVRLDGSIFQIAVDPGMAGQTAYFKFCSFNNVGRALQDLSAVTAYAYTLPTGQQTPQSVSLVARGNAMVNGGVVYKAAGTLAGWDSDAVTATPMKGGNISAQLGHGGTLAVGFVTSTASTADPSTNMYCINPNVGAGATYVLENGTVRYTGAAPVVGDLYDIHYDGFTLDYRLNGVTVWTTQLNGANLYGAVTMQDGGDLFADVQVQSSAIATPTYWKAAGLCIVNGTSAMKNGGSSAWDSCVYSVNGFPTCHVVAKPSATTGDNMMIGLSTNPTAGVSYTNANYALYQTNGSWYIFESGTQIGSAYATSSINDVASITYDGATITYKVNSAILRTVSVAGLTLYGFCPVQTPGAGWNSLEFGPTTNLATISIDNQVVDGAIFKRQQRNNLANNTNAGAWLHVGTLVLTGASSASFKWTTGSGYNSGGNQQAIVEFVVRAGNNTAAPNISGITAAVDGGTNPIYPEPAAPYSIVLVATGNSTSVSNTSWEIYIAAAAYTYGPLDSVINAEVGDSFTFSGAAGTYSGYPGTPPTNTWAGIQPAWRSDYTGRIAPHRGGIGPYGSVPPGSTSIAITYTSTSSSITINWSAGTLYRSDGTTTTVSAGGQTVTGLAASTIYDFGIYYDELAGAMALATGAGAVGTPAVACTTRLASVAAAMIANGAATFGWYSGTTTASGPGGGGGGTGCCLHGEQLIELANGRQVRAADLEVGQLLLCPDGPVRVAKLRAEPWHEWFRVTLSNGVSLLVAGDHRFMSPTDEQITAREIRLQQVVQALSGYVEVVALEIVRELGDKISIEVAEPHTYYVQGILSHNKYVC